MTRDIPPTPVFFVPGEEWFLLLAIDGVDIVDDGGDFICLSIVNFFS